MLPLVGVLETPAASGRYWLEGADTRTHFSGPDSEGMTYGMQLLMSSSKGGARAIVLVTLALVGAEPGGRLVPALLRIAFISSQGTLLIRSESSKTSRSERTWRAWNHGRRALG